MKVLKVIIVVILVAAFSPILLQALEGESDGVEVVAEDSAALSEAEQFAQDNGISVDLAESIQGMLGKTQYDLGDVYNFKQIDNWANGERYSMWMDMEYIWYAYCTGNDVLSIRDVYSNLVTG